jgi:hypothetical protein
LELEMELCEVVRLLELSKSPPRTAESTKEEIVKAMMDSGNASLIKEVIVNEIYSQLHMNPSSKDGDEFIEHAYLRSKHGEEIDVFVKWWLDNSGEPKYWSFKRMKELWPQAFTPKIERYVTPNLDDKWGQDFSPAPRKEEK